MEIEFRLILPHDASSVPVVRHVCLGTLKDLGVDEECSAAIEVAVSEACTNVLRHANGTGKEYEVGVSIDEGRCTICVRDSGAGFDAGKLRRAGLSSEGGRGVALMRALVDTVDFEAAPRHGTIVRLVKKLDLRDDSVLKRLTERAGRAEVLSTP